MRVLTEEERKKKVLATLKSREKHKERYKEYQREYEKRVKYTPMRRAHLLLTSYQAMDRKRGFGDDVDFDARWMVDNIFTKSCVHCGETDWRKLGCNRLDNTKGHTKDNVEPCCWECNQKLEYDRRKMKIYQYTPDGILVETWECAYQCEDKGFNRSGVQKCCSGKLKTYKGYRWSYTPL